MGIVRAVRAVGRRKVLAVSVAVGAGVAVAGLAVVGAGHGYPVQDVQLLSGSAWLASSQAGQLTLMDGASAEVAAQVQVAPPGHTLDVVQQGSTAYAVDDTAGTLRRIDGATFTPTQPATPIPGARSGLTAFADEHSLYVLDTRRGLLTTADPHTLAPGGPPISLAAQLSSGAASLDDAGRLWVIDNSTGDLTRVANGQRETTRGVAKPGHSLLTLVDGNPLVVDTVDRRAIAIDPDSGAVASSMDLDLRPTDTVAVSGSAHANRFYVAVSRGVLDICDVGAASCGVPVPLDNGNNELGAPIEAGDRLFVPDYTTGQVWVVDPDSRTVVATAQVLTPAVKFQLLNRDGVVFFNDPNSERAGVISLDGQVTQVAKYDPADPTKGLPGEQTDGGATPSANQGATATSTPPDTGQPTTPPRPTSRVTVPPAQPNPPLLPTSTSNPPPPSQLPTPTGSTPMTTPSAPVLTITLSNESPIVDQDINLSVSADTGTPTTAHWDFGDGQTGDGVTVTHHWAAQQTYQVTVQATMTGGAQGTTSVSITVNHPATTTVPNVVGLSQVAAQQALTGAGLTTTVQTVVSNTVPAGTVMSQSPGGGGTVGWGSAVQITVSSGKTAEFSLYDSACGATWTSGAGARPCPDTSGANDPDGFVLPRPECWVFTTGACYARFVETHPQYVTNGWIQGVYRLPQPIIAGDHFRTTIGFMKPSSGTPSPAEATFSVWVGGTEVWSAFLKSADDKVIPVDVDLSGHVGEQQLTLRVDGQVIGQCWASWVAPTFGG